MKNIKTIVAALTIFILCVNADCNKVDEVPKPAT